MTSAASAREALASLAAQPPDVLLSDIGMPGEDGYALIREVRSLEPARGGHIPAAALTAFTQAEDRKRRCWRASSSTSRSPSSPPSSPRAVARLAGRMN